MKGLTHDESRRELTEDARLAIMIERLVDLEANVGTSQSKVNEPSLNIVDTAPKKAGKEVDPPTTGKVINVV